ncbi:MAG: hypothetical protein COC15_00725 [Legionellales bacterium]|nr:MAG: hypothetical protein COC15_00725 [Legionellales bacterium]
MPQELQDAAIAVKFRSGNARVRLPGAKHSKSLKQFFQDNNVPPWERDAVPLVYVAGELVWVTLKN